MTSRRQVLQWSVGAFGLTARAHGRDLPPVDRIVWPHWGCLDHVADFVALGRHALDHLPELRRVPARTLTAEIEQRLGVDRQAGAAAFRAALRSSISRDFGHGDTQTVDGWQLSTTEVILATLAYRTFIPSVAAMRDLA